MLKQTGKGNTKTNLKKKGLLIQTGIIWLIEKV